MHIDDVDNLTREERLRLALLLSEIERELTKLRLREEHPEWSEKRVQIEFIRLLFLPAPLPKWLEKRFIAECDQFRPEGSAS